MALVEDKEGILRYAASLAADTVQRTSRVTPSEAPENLWGDTRHRYQSCPHLTAVTNRAGIRTTVEKCCAAVSEIQFDTIAFRGMSGALIAPILAYEMHKEIIMVRKKEINAASGMQAENRVHICTSFRGGVLSYGA